MAPRSKAQISKALAALEPPTSVLPTQTIARVEKALAHARYACQLPDKTVATFDLEERFRGTVWVERGNYVLVERYDPKEVEGQVVGKIINIARDEKAWRKMPYWPAEFPKFQDPDTDDEDSRTGKMPPSDSEDDA